MACFTVSYDLHKDRNYTRIIAQLEKWGAKRLLESLWIVQLQATAAAVREALKATVDADDSLAVLELTPRADWATWNAQKGGVELIKQLVAA